jgi:hypothetical protein
MASGTLEANVRQLRKVGQIASVILFALLSLLRAEVPAWAASGGFGPTGSLHTTRETQTATLLNNGLVLIAGGETSTNPIITSTAELYNPATGTFAVTGSLNTARYSHTATLLNNGLVLIAGGDGFAANGSITPLASAELYNPTTGNFTVTGSMITARIWHTATLLTNGKVLIAGGLGAGLGNLLASAEIYDPVAGTFTATGSLNTARDGHTATALNNGTVLVAGGNEKGATQTTAELYSLASGSFIATGNLVAARSSHTATLLNNGSVLIAGGVESGVPLSSAELYNPATGTFTGTGSLNTARYSDTATLLNNGTVLMAGGLGSGNLYLASAELYNPTTGTFAVTGNLNIARGFDTATLLIDGNVLAVAGHGSAGIIGSAELYQPTTLTPTGLESITLSPVNQWVAIGATQIFTATGTFSGNTTEMLASATWSSSNPEVATITNDSSNYGHVYGLASGTTTIEACAGSVCESTVVTIAPHTNLIIGSSAGAGAIWETHDDSGNLLNQGTLSVSRSSHSATLLTNGTVFVAGGQDAPGTWQILTIDGQTVSTGSLLNSFYSHLAVRLANGNVFLGGGTASPGAWEIHSPTGALVASGSLLGKRSPGAGAVALQNGNIWIAASGAGPHTDECSWEIHDINGNLLSNGTLNTCFASGKEFLLSNGDVILIGGFNAPNTYEIHTETGAFVRTGTITNAFDNSSGGVLVNNNVFLFESGYWEYVGFDSNANVTFDTAGTLFDSRLGAKGVVTSAGNIFITGGSAAPGTWEMWAPSGTTATLLSDGNLFDAHNVGHSDTHF